jgi:hypothetical protein
MDDSVIYNHTMDDILCAPVVRRSRQMKARVIKSMGKSLVLGDEYPVVRIDGSNIVIMQDGHTIGFSENYLRIIDDFSEERKKLSDERNELDRDIAILKARKAVVEAKIESIDAQIVNQTRMVL